MRSTMRCQFDKSDRAVLCGGRCDTRCEACLACQSTRPRQCDGSARDQHCPVAVSSRSCPTKLVSASRRCLSRNSFAIRLWVGVRQLAGRPARTRFAWNGAAHLTVNVAVSLRRPSTRAVISTPVRRSTRHGVHPSQPECRKRDLHHPQGTPRVYSCRDVHVTRCSPCRLAAHSRKSW